MSQAIVDPAELRRFAQNLKVFNSELQTQMSRLHGQSVGMGQSWRDQEHQKFMEEFEQTMLVLARFIESANQHIPFLLRKAERAEQYLQQR
ncbi:MAG: WXG100 family type VII secretion target [Planctomycetes bacterium]|nr:WXG100 family type VII secretion target [Planctomycetota bacterium]